MRRTKSAFRRGTEGREVVQTVLIDTKASLRDMGPAVTAVLVTLNDLVRRTRESGASSTLQNLGGFGEQIFIPTALQALDRLVEEAQPGEAEPTVLFDLARKALAQTVGALLQGEATELSLPVETAIERLTYLATDVGISGLFSAFLGNFVVGLTLFSSGYIIAESLGVSRRLENIEKKDELEEEVRRQAERAGQRLAGDILQGPTLVAVEARDMRRLSDLVSSILGEASWVLEE